MLSINISELVIRNNANAKSFQRGEACYQMDSVLSVTQRGDEIQGEVQGSEEQPYRVTIASHSNEVTAICTCPYNYDGWCKHIVAVALTCDRQPNIIENRPSLAQLLDKLNHIQTQYLVQELVEEHPELIDEIDGYVTAIASPAPTAKTTKSPRKQTVNTAQIKAKVHQTFRDAVNSWESGYDYADETVNEELQSLIADAVECCEQDDGNNALAILEAITDACVSDWNYVDDYGMDKDEILPALNAAWCEAILSTELTPEECTDMQINLETWQDEWSADFSLAIASLQQGWDYPPLLQILAGNTTQSGMWENQEIPYYADDLALIRLKLLERQERYQEYLYLASSEGQTKQYLTMLGHLGRVEEAVATAQTQMSTMEEAFALAQTLQQQKALQQALNIALQGLSLPGKCQHQLGIWAAELAENLDDINAAIIARKIAFQGNPTYDDYRIIENLAKENWVNIKSDLLQILRTVTMYGITEAKVNIFLHEGLIIDAISCVNELHSYNSELIYRVMDAAISVNPEWVIENSRRRAEKIMDAGKSEYYRDAVEWLKKARAAYLASNQQAEWKRYYHQLMEIHGRKRKLMELLRQKVMG
ncbi:SWIM zinc finger domain-containing protein [Anabaena cylindrica FACHB-243]|uniref:Zinc finger SWIM domain-containing protein n=1 Tax=Anabaena cylindrica (strain ATCC 27899 / PCC 7122) TaxID=272123 RepID=K9ZGF6_ANACC|nr:MULTISPECIES: SWIM zinc finger family protein [Anabaena]AFZ58303.1 zinc finger SWIM domain-containing protein [Anabaena cylindrica PCC 7122]MBD2416895.1 SWIM zinc finger domain-containing protein [Anabaena cylindrica FACHB-243]MBY5281906.1 SWIM zinc finger domain-containing protein [Anabaena sp. CCAP 1446/1C]MBY5308618.1 SWIM zinc finger domain-containing protein [Anabaena sp. CCAP 1446/1C]MCM2406427.1 SWIM zinc finger family protein [Anabaena sp. CCAP 1446/1C]